MLSIVRRGFVIAGMISGILAAAPANAQMHTAEQEVLAFMIEGYGQRAILDDSTFGIPCERFGDACELPDGVPADAWAEYLRVTRAPALLRDLLPSGLDVVFQSEHVEDPAVPCERRPTKLTLSRVGLSADGRAAVVYYAQWIPMQHFGCGAGRGGTLLLRKSSDGEWEVDAPLRIFIS